MAAPEDTNPTPSPAAAPVPATTVEWSAQGSHLIIKVLGVDTADPVAEARLVDMGRLAEATTSNGIRWKKVLSDGQGNFSLPWNSAKDPSDVGITGGAEGVLLGVLLGNSGKMIPQLTVIIENVERIWNPVNDVIRVNCTFYAQQQVPVPAAVP